MGVVHAFNIMENLKDLSINMEKINLTFTGIKELDFLKDDFKSYQFLSFSLNDNKLLSFNEFSNLLYEEGETYIVSNSMKIDFFLKLKNNHTAYVDFYREEGILCSNICFFIDSIDYEGLDTGKKKINFLRSMTEKFCDKYKIDYFVCKLYEDDLDFYFDTFGFGKSYVDLKKGSKSIIPRCF